MLNVEYVFCEKKYQDGILRMEYCISTFDNTGRRDFTHFGSEMRF